MDWHTLYSKYSKMNESELREAILSLTDIGTGSEIADVFSHVDNAEIRLRLLDKAMELGASFTEADYVRFDEQIPSALYVKIAKYGNMVFGTAEEVTEALVAITDTNARRALYERSYIEDVSFTRLQLNRIGYEDIDSAHDDVEDDAPPRSRGLVGFFKRLFGHKDDIEEA